MITAISKYGSFNKTTLDGVGCKDPFNPDQTVQFANRSEDCTQGGGKPFLGCRKVFQESLSNRFLAYESIDYIQQFFTFFKFGIRKENLIPEFIFVDAL